MTALEPRAYRWLFEGVLQGAPLGIAVFDTQLRYLEINRRLAAMHGLSREAHIGRLLSELIPDPASHHVMELMRHVLATGECVEEVEICYEDKLVPGRQVTCLASYHPLRGESELLGVYAFVEDITARRQAELQRDEWLAREHVARERAEASAQALGESEARYRVILASLDEGIVVHGGDGGILTVNASAERILGLTVEQLTGRSSMDPRWQVIHEDGTLFPGQEHPAMVALRTARPVRDVTMGVRRPDGSLVWLSVNAQPLLQPDARRPHLVVASFFDVTEFRRALQSIHLSEQRFRSLVEATTQMVWTADANGQAHEDIPGWLAYTGQAPESFRDRRWIEAIHPEDREPSLALWREALERKAPLRMEQRVRRHDGEYRLFLVRAVPVLAADGSVREWIGTHTDISEARRAESERARLLGEAQEAVRARDEFLTVAAHELRTPLTSLRLHLRMLQRQLSCPAVELGVQPTSRCETMERQLERLTNLITALLDVSRLAAGHLSLEPRRLDLSQLVTQLSDAFTSEFQRVGARLQLRGAREPLVGVWDPLRVEQILANLLSNAVRYGAGKPVVVTLGSQGAQAVVTVEDQGIGISELDLARIFGKFERAVSERHYGGLGLGLYITRQILDAMGGSIEVSSTLGQGSTFTLRLPLEPPPPP